MLAMYVANVLHKSNVGSTAIVVILLGININTQGTPPGLWMYHLSRTRAVTGTRCLFIVQLVSERVMGVKFEKVAEVRDHEEEREERGRRCELFFSLI